MTASPVPAEVLDRLARLERANRRWRRAALAGLLGAAAMALMGQSRDRAMRAQRFDVVDDAGAVRATFGLNEDGEALLGFYDAEGTLVVLHSEAAPAASNPAPSGDETRYRDEENQAERALNNLGRSLSDTLNSAEQALDRQRERN